MTLDFDERDRQSVVHDLASGDEEVRRLAVERVAALSLDEAVRLLVERLGDPSWRVRKAAVERLVACPEGSGAAEGLIAALADGENPGRRNAAVEALVRCGTRVVPRLIEATSGDDADVRKFAVDALAGIGDPRATSALVDRLGDLDPNVRAAAADALGLIGGEEAERVLHQTAVCESEDRLVRFSALHALEARELQLRARDLAPVLDDAMLHPAGLALLGRADDQEGVAILLKALGSGRRATREAAMRALLRVLSAVDGEQAESLVSRIRQASLETPALVESGVARLEEADLATRLVLVQFLGLLQSEPAVVPILLAGRDEALWEVALSTLASLGERAERAIDAAWERLDVQARRDACVLFGRTRGAGAGARLLAALEEPIPEIRTAAAGSIGARRLEGGLSPLVRQLERAAADEDFESEEELAALTGALIALAGPGAAPAVTRQAVDLLASRLEGAAEGVRRAIAKVLGGIGRREDAGLVSLLLKDPGARVRRAAVDALARLEPGTAAEPLRLALADESPLVRMAAAAALGTSQSHEVLDDLRHLADDEDPLVRAAGVRALGTRFGRARDGAWWSTVQQLLYAALSDAAPVALAALQTLRELRSSDAARVIPVLTRSEPEVLQEAIRCLSAVGEATHMDALQPLVSHPDWSVRAEAIQALAERRRVNALPAILRRLETEQDEFVRDAILRALKRLEG